MLSNITRYDIRESTMARRIRTCLPHLLETLAAVLLTLGNAAMAAPVIDLPGAQPPQHDAMTALSSRLSAVKSAILRSTSRRCSPAM